jgi:hypothetical protein
MKRFLVGSIAGMNLLALSSMANLIIDTRPNANTTISPFGLGYNATFGQTITVPLTDSSLQSFTLQMRQNLANNTIQCATYVFAWDAVNSRAAGPALFSSAPLSLTATMQDYTFNTGGLGLTPGGRYVLFASTSLFPGQTSAGMWSFSGSDAYAGGGFVYLANGTDSSQWTTATWNTSHVSGDAGFQAVFAPVPEPTTMISGTLLLLPFGLSTYRHLFKKASALPRVGRPRISR